MSTKLSQITLKTPDEALGLFNEMFERARTDRPTLTKGVFFEEIVYAFANPKTIEKTVDNPELLEELERLIFAKLSEKK